jgi:hypothetical protein
MKVFFAGSTTELEKSYPLYKKICDSIIGQGHELTRNWLDEGREIFNKKIAVDYEEMYDDIISSILYADVGVVEGSLKGLSTGHQITVALQKGKPVLFLRKKNSSSAFSLMIRGIHSDLLTEVEYDNIDDLPFIIKDFLDKNKKGKKIRFNLVLNQKEQQYIDWASHNYNKTKTDIIREIIIDKMNSDKNYRGGV